MIAAYLGGQPDDAFASPVRADPAGLPPMLIQVGSEEVLLSDSLTFAHKSALAGIEVRLHVAPEMPHATYQEKSTQYYPRDALRMGMEGHVTLRVEIDRRGKIHGVRVIKKAGYGFDEAAVRMMWKFKFTPARTRDGQPVDFLLTWGITFRPSDW